MSRIEVIAEEADAVLEHSLRLKQSLTTITDPSILDDTQIQHLISLVEPIHDAAANLAKERKVAMKKAIDGKVKEMGYRLDLEGTAIYNRVEEMSAMRGRVEQVTDADVLLAQSKASSLCYGTDQSPIS